MIEREPSLPLRVGDADTVSPDLPGISLLVARPRRRGDRMKLRELIMGVGSAALLLDDWGANHESESFRDFRAAHLRSHRHVFSNQRSAAREDSAHRRDRGFD